MAPDNIGCYSPHDPPYTLSWIGPTNKAEMVADVVQALGVLTADETEAVCKQCEGKQVEEVTRRRCMAWIAAARRKDSSYSNIFASVRVCSLHFQSGQPAYEMLDTHPDWAPSLLLGHNEVKLTDKNRFARQIRRRERSGVRAGEKVEDKVRSEAEERARQEAEEEAAQ
ncbi:uncharacterized protein LOC127442239 isoform X3 [Myxocyprinus asiaticus]|uniref:uncharacterized protein LOC127442239 isoform X2 n=1 Tax=Myxocyprinus asiaticus TaxID=70543 RepID=UPI0022215B74|nr:uncharacterized protein LOC127442239 isoform X2 [Myxocyprinus asiaticus]XP_051556091.1 uncharacterized protein LOC127442239 isoform X3 [Myxocyprinus asiaticus]